MIKKALLDNEIDPFNRQPLKREELIELTDLKKKLDEWKILKKKELKEKGTLQCKKGTMEIEDEEQFIKNNHQNLFNNLQ